MSQYRSRDYKKYFFQFHFRSVELLFLASGKYPTYFTIKRVEITQWLEYYMKFGLFGTGICH